MIIPIFRNNIRVVAIKPDSSSELSQQKQSEDAIRLDFTLDDYIELKIGDYISLEKTKQLYVLNKKPRVIESPKNYRYECIFEGGIHQLRKTKVFLITNKEVGFYKDYKFPLTGNAETLLSFIVDNLNRNGGNYVAGIFKETATITINFNKWNVFEAITSIANTLEFDWYLDGKTLNFDKKQHDTAYVLQVGRKVGFTELTRARVESSNIVTVLYGYGSSDNMPPRTGSDITYDSNLLTENRLCFDGENDESKLSNNIDKYGTIEDVQEFDIKPEFTGVISSINPENLNVFYDDSIEFDINEQLLPTIKPKITFLTGKLIGLTFDISYINSNKQITLDTYSDESGDYPNSIIHAEVGDSYKLFDIIMPLIPYVSDAKIRLQEATQLSLDKKSKPLESYSGELEDEYVESKEISLNIGDLTRVISSSFEIDNLYEIKALKQGIANPYKYSITFGDILPKGLLASLKTVKFDTDQNIYNVSKTSNVTNIIEEGSEWQTW